MKKGLLFFSILFMFSCSNENEITITPQNHENVATTASRVLPPIENATDAMFHEYVTSSEYVNLQSKIESFNLKSRFPEAIQFASKSQLVSWFEVNLSSTDFATISEAIQDWDEIVNLQQAEPSKFPTIYNFMASAPEELAVATYTKWLNLKDLPLNTTGNDCDKSFRTCTNDANFNYFRFSKTFSQDSQIMAEGKRQHDAALDWCRDRYLDCIKN